jgi:hypothetical protein
MSKARAAPPSRAPTPVAAQPTNQITLQSALQLLGARLVKLESTSKESITAIERKLGAQDAYVTDNIPDIDQITQAFKEVNNRMIDLEARLAALEPGEKKPVKKGRASGTVKLSDEGPGISFSADE